MSEDLLRLTQWLSPSFPTGAFAYSQGLEWAFGPGGVTDRAGVEAWLAWMLRHGPGWSDAVLLALALDPGADLGRLADLARALAPSAGRLREMDEQGRAMGLTLAALGEAGGEDLPLPVALGRAARGLDLPKEVIVAQFLQAWAVNLAIIAVRAVPLGQGEGQAIVQALQPVILELAVAAAAGGRGGPGHGGVRRRPGRDAAGSDGSQDLPDMSENGPLRVGIGGPVGAGKTTLTEKLCAALAGRCEMAVITNDIYTREDAEYLTRAQVLAAARIRGVETGGCPHTAIREDASINLAAVADLNAAFPDLDLILIESGGDNLAATFSAPNLPI